MFEFTVPLSKEFLLKRISEEDIFERYLGIRPDYGKVYRNPLRRDDNPSCGFYVNKSSRIKFVDDGGGFNWDCFNVIEYLFKCDFRQAMKIVAGDFGITGVSTSNPALHRVIREKEKLELRIRQRDWNREDGAYWHSRYYQTRRDLEALAIFPVSHCWYARPSGNLDLFYTYKPGDPAYAYCFGGFDYKIYFPFRDKRGRFRQNRGDIVQGESWLPEKGHILVITKSYKDVACLRKFSSLMDMHSVAPMSETQLIGEDKVNDWKQRFDYVFTLFDFDRAGIKLMREYEKTYDIPGILFGSSYKKGLFLKGTGHIKDFADHLHVKRWEETEKLIHQAYNIYVG